METRINELENRLTDLEIAVGEGYVDMIQGLEEIKKEMHDTKLLVLNSKGSKVERMMRPQSERRLN